MVVGPVLRQAALDAPVADGVAQFAADNLQHSRLEVDRLMQQYQLKLADRQCSMVELSQRIQSMIVMLTTCLWAAKQSDELVKTAAIVLGREIRRNLTGKRPTSEDFRLVTKLGADIAEGGFKAIAGIDDFEILMPYQHMTAAGRPRGVRHALAPSPRGESLRPLPSPQSLRILRFRGAAMANAFRLEELDGQIALLTFDVPGKSVNTFGQPVLLELNRLVNELAKRTDLRGLLLKSGKPGQFIAGADLNELGALAYSTKEQVAPALAAGHDLFNRVSRLPFPTVALIDGNCMGGGTEISLAMDYRLAAANPATKIGLPEVKVGIIPGWGERSGCRASSASSRRSR